MSHVRQRESIADRAPDDALVRRVTKTLAESRLVAMPTETVYGIAARADDPRALENLAEAKGRPRELGMTWHVGSTSALERFPHVSPMARRIVERYWPGPLTLVLPGTPSGLELVAREGWTGVRMPAHLGTSGILGGAPFPVVLSSANRHGSPPLCEADAIEAGFGEHLALVLDGGPSRLGESSCVLQLGPGKFDLLREGLHDLASLRRVAGLKIGFACTGNTCRSPMAEAMARKLLAEKLACDPARIGDFGFEVVSMGVMASTGAPASPLAVKVMREDGVNLAAHVSRPAIADELRGLDRVYCMTSSQANSLIGLLPPTQGRHVELLDPRGEDIPDPMGGSRADYRHAADRIRRAIEERLSDWA